jgi:hypothetical protein
VLVEFHKNGSPKPHADAFQFGVRYSLNGKRKLDPAATLDEAPVILKDHNVRLYAQTLKLYPEPLIKRIARRVPFRYSIGKGGYHDAFQVSNHCIGRNVFFSDTHGSTPSGCEHKCRAS